VGLTPATAFGLAVGAIFLAGFMIVIVNGSVFAMLQAIVPSEVQGRVFTVVASGSGIMAPLGLAIAGPVADALGVRVWFAAAGGVMLAIGIGGLFVPSIINIENRPPVSASLRAQPTNPAAANAR
jgi:DHA3 family macrolide efflux protein-like MFS transporter